MTEQALVEFQIILSEWFIPISIGIVSIEHQRKEKTKKLVESTRNIC